MSWAGEQVRRELSRAVRRGQGTPFKTQAEVDALAAAFQRTGGTPQQTQLGADASGVAFFWIGRSAVGGEDRVA